MDYSYRYGFGFWGKTFMFPIESLSNIDLNSLSETNETNFSLSVSHKVFEVSIKGLVTENVFRIEINGIEGRALLSHQNEAEHRINKEICQDHQLYFPFMTETNDLVLPLNDRKAENVLISGGKGSSLASLNYLRQNLQNSVNVEIPKGIVVTCNAYKLMLDQNKDIDNYINNMKRVVRFVDIYKKRLIFALITKNYLFSETDLLKKECIHVVNAFKSSELPQEIRDQILYNLKLLFNQNDINNKSFAVRSSASGEDSEDMSAAGQMTTYLGIKGSDEICSAVVKCWSSQFEFVAIEYKRGYGQELNSMMAVVIQEMVDCDSAGVLFTCDPVSGNERELIISANYGIGESVVSAMAEPDTIRVEINIKDNSMNERSVRGIKSITIGSKSKSIKMKGSGVGTVEVETTQPNKCCLSVENITQLSTIALEV